MRNPRAALRTLGRYDGPMTSMTLSMARDVRIEPRAGGAGRSRNFVRA
jgi:hypothetical protein